MPYFPTDESKETPKSPRQSPDLLYEPLEEGRDEEFAPTVMPRPVGNSFLFRLNVSIVVVLVLVALARGFWWPGDPEPETEEVVAPPPRVTETPIPEPEIVEESSDPEDDRDIEEAEAREEEGADEYQILQSAPVESTVSPEPAAPAPDEPAAPAAPEAIVGPEAPEETPRPRQPEPWEAANQPKGLLRPGPGVSPPVPLHLPRYGYPPAARGTGISAGVRVALLVDEKGRVIDAVVREGAPEGLGFDQVALQAAKKTSFQPATRYDRPGKMWTELILEFVE
jgi:TonB family protein